MPLYEYYCADCQAKFEALRPMSQADTAIECKACQSKRTSRALSLFATHTSPEAGDTKAIGLGSGGGCGCGSSCGCRGH